MKTTAANYETLIVIFAEPTRTRWTISSTPPKWSIDRLVSA